MAALLPKTAGVRALLRRVDADPYRYAVRDAILAEDRATFANLAEQPAALVQPPGFVAFLGESMAIGVERRRQLLASAASRWSGDLGLLMTLGDTYRNNPGLSVNEQVRWYQAAVAVAPTNPAGHNGLGLAMLKNSQWDEAVTYLRKCVALDPKDATAYSSLGVALTINGQWDEAIASYRKVIEIDPTSAGAYSNLGNALNAFAQFWEDVAALLKTAAEPASPPKK